MSNLLKAEAMVYGSENYPDIFGYVSFCETSLGTLVTASVKGLPVSDKECENGVFAFHVHSGGSCTGNKDDPFANADGHYNPKNCPHPFHAGDMPPLFAFKDKAYLSFITDRFTPSEIVGKTVIIHRSPDDLHTQPSGAAGEKIACGVIKAVKTR